MWAAVGILFLVCLWGGWRWLKAPLWHRNISLFQLAPFLTILLDRGFDGGLMFVKREGRANAPFLQFLKYIKNGVRGIQVDFPDAPWSRETYPRLRDALLASNIEFLEEATFRDDTRTFLSIDCRKDLLKAQRIAELAAELVLGLDEKGLVEVSFQNVSPREETIGR